MDMVDMDMVDMDMVNMDMMDMDMGDVDMVDVDPIPGGKAAASKMLKPLCHWSLCEPARKYDDQ